MSVRSPPVPVRLTEALRDYPEHIEKLQEVLTNIAEKPRSVRPRFERAVDVLEALLDNFMVDAREELDQAKASGDASLIAMAEARFRLMSQISLKQFWIGDEGLWDYFKEA